MRKNKKNPVPIFIRTGYTRVTTLIHKQLTLLTLQSTAKAIPLHTITGRFPSQPTRKSFGAQLQDVFVAIIREPLISRHLSVRNCSGYYFLSQLLFSCNKPWLITNYTYLILRSIAWHKQIVKDFTVSFKEICTYSMLRNVNHNVHVSMKGV